MIRYKHNALESAYNNRCKGYASCNTFSRSVTLSFIDKVVQVLQSGCNLNSMVATTPIVAYLATHFCNPVCGVYLPFNPEAGCNHRE